ncbi:MAG: hypothetical protein ICV62_01630 [Cyanobacteria bacterium Co-bin13]|nr:hypothetical protein [Cyanobacteria bacterium Co-bin13]
MLGRQLSDLIANVVLVQLFFDGYLFFDCCSMVVNVDADVNVHSCLTVDYAS